MKNDKNLLIAREGMIYTNGQEVFGYQIHIGEGVNKDGFYEITIEEYNLLQEKSGGDNE